MVYARVVVFQEPKESNGTSPIHVTRYLQFSAWDYYLYIQNNVLLTADFISEDEYRAALRKITM